MFNVFHKLKYFRSPRSILNAKAIKNVRINLTTFALVGSGFSLYANQSYCEPVQVYNPAINTSNPFLLSELKEINLKKEEKSIVQTLK